MRILFVHQNFPGQYRHLARHYASLPEHEVVAVGEKANIVRQRPQLPGVKLLGYEMPASGTPKASAEDSLRRAIQRGRIVAAGAARLRRSGFRPDVVFAHIGWGEALFLKDVFPDALVLLYCEFFYRARGGDLGFDPEFPVTAEKVLRLRLMNAPLLMALDASDWGVAPTVWQRRQFPAVHASRIGVVHEGIDTDCVTERADARFAIPGTGLTLSREDEVVTYVARNLEPYRGFHVFMRTIPEIQKRRPRAQVVIAGGDEVSYSPRLPEGDTWRARMLREMRGKIDLSRVHFTGRIAYRDYVSLLQVSSAHVYLTYPFVLSWSLLEAMSAGCPVVASRTPPVEEVIVHGRNGLLADFFSPGDIAARVDELLRRPDDARGLRDAARHTAAERYDLKRVCLPQQVALVDRLLSQAKKNRPARPGGSSERQAASAGPSSSASLPGRAACG
jgi:glycosyltransferase involved in cell wall biosynthesis